jgi:hypothetical protein
MEPGNSRYRAIRNCGDIVMPAIAVPPASSMTGVCGYLVATASPDGTIDFAFQRLGIDDLTRASPDCPEGVSALVRRAEQAVISERSFSRG